MSTVSVFAAAMSRSELAPCPSPSPPSASSPPPRLPLNPSTPSHPFFLSRIFLNSLSPASPSPANNCDRQLRRLSFFPAILSANSSSVHGLFA